MRTDEQLYNLLVSSKCYQDTVNDTDKNKVIKARTGRPSLAPRSNIALVAWELGKRAYAQEQGQPDPDPDPVPGVDKTQYPPLAYSESPGGEPSARYNVHINCTWNDGRQRWQGKHGDEYDEGGRETTGHRITKVVAGLKTSNMMDQNEAWTPYEWMGTTFPPYPDECWKR